MRRTGPCLVGIVILTLGVCVGVGAAAHEEPDQSILGIEVEAGGDAAVYYIQSYNLNNSTQQDQYESVATNQSAQTAHQEVIVAELSDAAALGRNETDLEMQITNGSVYTYEEEGWGRLVVRVDWRSLAFADEQRVVVSEPFRGGYEPDLSRVGIHGPEGYIRGALQPNPIRAQQNNGLWSPRTSNFSIFYAEFQASDGSVDDRGSLDGNGDTDRETRSPNGPSDDEDMNSDDFFEGEEYTDVVVFLRALSIALIPVVIVLFAVRDW